MKTLMGATSMDSLIMDVFIILAVVVAASLLFYFAWEAIEAATGKKKVSKPEEPAKKEEPVKTVEGMSDFDIDSKEEEQTDGVKKTEVVEVDNSKAEEEKKKAEEEAAEQERLIAERRAFLEAKRQELIRRMQSEAEKEQEKEEPEEEETAVEEAHEEQTQVEEEEEVVEEKENLDEERKALQAEKEKYETMVKELETAKAQLAKEKAAVVVETKVVPTNGVLSLDELKAKLAEAEEKQKITDKEFKQCKKEYNPLRKVWTTHERDERKLRRKEALVAKQKVLLYGVNNYADIDEEKAKKLAEDLDLLDGLKLSVQHCEEVMEKNAERYPLLEKMFNVLQARNDELKADIEYYKSEIAKLENADSEE